MPEDVYARKAGRLKRADIGEVEGLKLGRYPFAAASKRYMDRRYGTVAKTTFEEETRKYAMLGRMFETLKEEGKVITTDPRHLKRGDIQQFMASLKDRGLDSSAQDKYLQLLNSLLRAYKNFVLEEMKADGVRFPRPGRKPIRVIDEDDLQAIFETVTAMTKWRGVMARGMTALYFATGVRPSEARLARLEDLDLEKMTFFVRHPKGEGSWASSSEVEIIREDMLPLLRQFMEERAVRLKKAGRNESNALFPSLSSKDGFYTAHGFQGIKARIEELSGVSFRLKDFRSTLTSITVNGDMSRLPAMSAQLRHASVTTTQRSYYAMERGVAGRQLRNAWKEHPINVLKNPVIDSEERLPGYG
ncbi:MAG: site-specific integrase [Methanomassiliicoccales archaeon]